MQIVLGTNNKKKLREMEMLLGPLGFVLKILADFDNAIEVEETGNTFAENAALKASEQARHLNHWVIGEDSGLSVDALEGRPGIYSARYAGPESNDESNIDKLLKELDGVPALSRTAHYTSHIALSDPAGNIVASCEDYCCGLIGNSRMGTAGFGYDPIFIIPEYDQTFGQLGDAVKSVLSHRARAIRQFTPLFLAAIRETTSKT